MGDKILHTVTSRFVLALPSEDAETDLSPRGYVSEGLLNTLIAMNKKTDSSLWALATDVLGPTWFSEKSGYSKTAPLRTHVAMTPEACEASSLFARNAWQSLPDAVESVSAKVLSPHWRLSSIGLEVLSDTTSLNATPLLNAFNAFEVMMESAFFSAWDLANSNSNEGFSSVAMDTSLMRATSQNISNLILARLDRIVSLFCHTLVGIVAWKRNVFDRLEGMRVPSIVTRPHDHLEEEILERVDRFVRQRKESATLMRGEDYAVPSIKTTAVVVGDTENFLPFFRGAFYDTVLGSRVMDKLEPLLSAEYGFVLARAETFRLSTAAENEVEKKRRAALSESERRAEDAVPKGVTVFPYETKAGEWDTRGVDDLHREVKREMKNDPSLSVEDAVKIIFNRQLLFSNFAITRARGVAVFYCLWNMLFLAAGIKAMSTPSCISSGRMRRRLLVDNILLDFHALLRCPTCSVGIAVKMSDSFAFVDTLRHGREEDVIHKMKRAFGDTVLQFKDHPAKLQEAFKSLLELRWPETPHTATVGRKKLAEVDRQTQMLYLKDKAEFTKIQMVSSQRAVGYALFGVYALLASSLYDDDDSDDVKSNSPSWLQTVDSVLRASPTGTGMKNPRGLTPPQTRVNDLLCAAGVWSLRNAVRMKRWVLSKYDSGFPGAPLPLINVLGGNEVWLERIMEHPALNAPSDGTVSDIFAQFQDHVDAARGNVSLSYAVYAALSALGRKVSSSSAGRDTHPFSDRGDMVWSASRIEAMTKEELSALVVFPLTEYD